MKRLFPVVLAMLVALFVAACGSSSTSSSGGGGSSHVANTPVTQYSSNAKTLNIVAGSEQEGILQKVVVPWCEKHGYICNYNLLGSVDQARLLQSGKAPYDAFWFASSVFEQLGDQSNVLKDVQPMFITPIVFAGWKSEMQRLGFIGRNVSIGDIIKAVESKEVKVWATNPTQSNSGATTLFAFLNYFAGNQPTTQLTEQQLRSQPVVEGIKRFVDAISKTPPSTGEMANDCIAHRSECQTMFTYEDLVIEKDQKLVKEGREPLYAVYPRGSLAISDAPLGFFPHGNNQGKEAAFKALQAFILSPEGQAQVEALGRRPYTSIGLSFPGANPKVFNPEWGIQANVNEPTIHYPNAEVIQSTLNNYQLAYRTPVDEFECIDGSGSMGENGGWNQVDEAEELLLNPAQASKYLLQVNPLDETTVVVFDENTKAGPWTVVGNNPNQLLDLRNKIQSQTPGGGTGIFRCLGKAAKHFQSVASKGLKRLVILMTDGQDNVGNSGEANTLAAMHIPVIAVGFGDEVDVETLKSIAAETGGAFIPATNVVTALREATGYK
jgi:Ca-activated chloride channel homolog